MSTSKYLNGNGLSEVWTNTKNYIAAQLLGKSDVGHTHSASEITDFPSLATVATSGSYNDLSNKPTIPTVNNATLTIQKNGTNVQTFTANQSTNATANIIVPTKVSELDNDSNYLTSVPNLDASKITSGTIDIARLPAGALESLPTNSTPFHNAYPRCKYLGTSITDAQNTAIKNRTYDDLFIGDYWTINGVNWRIVAIDYYYNVGDTNFDKGNIIVMPDTVLYNAQMNSTDTTTGSYAGSLMKKQNLNSARTIAKNAFGSHLANHRLLVNDSWYNSDGVELPNEIQIYGTRVWSSALKAYSVGTQKQQFPLMLFAPQFVNIRHDYWLQDISSVKDSAVFSLVSGGGGADDFRASVSHGVRPSVTLSYI